MSARSRASATAAICAAAPVLLDPSIVLAADHAVFGIYTIWFDGAGDEDREEIDRFLECLVYGSNLNSYWHGEAGLEIRGSWTVPPPPSSLEWTEVHGYLTPQIESGHVPPPGADETPLYLVFGGAPTVFIDSCGKNGEEIVAGRNAGVALVRNFPLCWPTGDSVRTETQIALHEIVETVDRVLGYGTCAGGGSCRGVAICEDPCDTFVGLSCAGAPSSTWTGCEGGQVEGWVVQKLGYSGRDPEKCDQCMECDFTPRACDPMEPECAAVPPRSDPPNSTPSRGCTIGGEGENPSGSDTNWLWLCVILCVARTSQSRYACD